MSYRVYGNYPTKHARIHAVTCGYLHQNTDALQGPRHFHSPVLPARQDAQQWMVQNCPADWEDLGNCFFCAAV
jgi:hypothetical protein